MASFDAFLPLLNRGLRRNYDLVGQVYPVMGKTLFHMYDTNALYDQVQNYAGYGTLPQVRTFGGEITESSINRSFPKTYTQIQRGLKDVIPTEFIKYDQYGLVSRWCTSRGGALAEIYATNDELLAAAFWAAGFATVTPAPGSFDGQPLFSLSHPLSPQNPAQVQANRPATNLPLGFAGLDAARANLEQQLKANGLTIYMNNIKTLGFNPNQERLAVHLQKFDWMPDTSDRNMNTLKGRFDLLSWPYWRASGSINPTAYNSWFVQGEKHYCEWYTGEGMTFETEKIVGTRSVMAASFQSQVMGASNWVGTFGSPGP